MRLIRGVETPRFHARVPRVCSGEVRAWVRWPVGSGRGAVEMFVYQHGYRMTVAELGVQVSTGRKYRFGTGLRYWPSGGAPSDCVHAGIGGRSKLSAGHAAEVQEFSGMDICPYS